MPSFNPNLLDHKDGSELLLFFSFLDEYLLEDLKSLKKLGKKTSGRCNYPMVLTLISGMDLLGTFANGKRVKGKNCIKKFIEKYMPESYQTSIDILYELIRNGGTHYYLMRKGIAIDRQNTELHLKKTQDWFHLNIEIFYQDFLNAYSRARNDIIDEITNKNQTYTQGFESLRTVIEAKDKFDAGIMNRIKTDTLLHPESPGASLGFYSMEK